MDKNYYRTNFGALLNLISNKNYSTSLVWKSLYFIYYVITLSIIFEALFDKGYIVLTVLSSIIFILNGRKYEDRELHITEYLPISYKIRIRQVFFTTYILLFGAVIIDFIVKYIYNRESFIGYIYVLLILCIISNLAIIQMILTKRSFFNFIVIDTLIYAIAVKGISLIFNGYTIGTFDNSKIDWTKIILLILVAIVFQIMSEKFIESFKNNKKTNKIIQWIVVTVAMIIIGVHIYQATQGFNEGFKKAYNTEETKIINSNDSKQGE